MRSTIVQLDEHIYRQTTCICPRLGGLGRYVIDGYAQLDYSQMLAGALLVAALAIVIDLLLVGVQRLVVSPGLGQSGVSRRRAWLRHHETNRRNRRSLRER